MQLNIKSEINPIRLVITHKPGNEHEHMTPSSLKEKMINANGNLIPNPDYLLFDDLIYLDKALKEHNELYDILHYYTDGNCYEFIDLLEIIIQDNKIKNLLIADCIMLEKELYKNKIDINYLITLKSKELIKVILSGYHNDKKVYLMN